MGKHNERKQDGRPILIPPAAIDKLLALPRPLNTNCIALYIFYLKLAVKQKTNRIWCEDSYALKGLKWSEGKLKRTKKQLVEMGYIEVERQRNELGQVGKSYIKLKYYPRKETIENAEWLYGHNSRPGHFHSKEAILAEIERRMNQEIKDLQRRATKLMTKHARREIRAKRLAKQKQSTVSTKNAPTACGTKNAPQASKKQSACGTKMTPQASKKQSACGTKKPPEAKTSTSAYSKRKRNAYNTYTVVKRRDDSECLIEGLEDKLSNTRKQDKFYYKRSVQLCNALKSKRKIFRKVNIDKWSAEFKKLHIEDEVEKSRIKEVLSWYVKHIGEDFVPEAYSAKSFSDKFEQIVAAMERSQNPELQKKLDYRPGDPKDDFNVETREWTDKDGVKHREDSIDYGEPEQDEDE